jgi:hypothetical protein
VERRQLGRRSAEVGPGELTAGVGIDRDGLFRALDAADVAYVLVGSVAAEAYGAQVSPRDFDIVPDTAAANLAHVAALLAELDAKPQFDPDWPFSRAECDAWQPTPPTEENLDHLFETRLGLFDVVSWRAGRYERLRPRAAIAEHNGIPVPVAHIEHLIEPMRMHKAKHQERRPQLEAALAQGVLPSFE